MSKSIIEELSEERKHLQDIGELPDWYTTPGWQLFKEKYVYKGQHVKEAYHRIAKAAAFHMPNESLEWEQKFFDVMWKGWLAPSTPVMANMGTDRGCPVSCFIKGTLVNTDRGQVPIEKLQIGDKVLTHENRFQCITDTMNRVSDDLYELSINGEDFVLTGNHLVLTKEDEWVRTDELDPKRHNIVQLGPSPLE